jgi:hypothetical protein
MDRHLETEDFELPAAALPRVAPRCERALVARSLSRKPRVGC